MGVRAATVARVVVIARTKCRLQLRRAHPRRQTRVLIKRVALGDVKIVLAARAARAGKVVRAARECLLKRRLRLVRLRFPPRLEQKCRLLARLRSVLAVKAARGGKVALAVMGNVRAVLNARNVPVVSASLAPTRRRPAPQLRPRRPKRLRFRRQRQNGKVAPGVKAAKVATSAVIIVKSARMRGAQKCRLLQRPP